MNVNDLKLSDRQHRILFRVLSHRDRDLLQILNGGAISGAEILRISELLTEEMCGSGLAADDEPNEYGQSLEELVGVLIKAKIELCG